MPMATRKSRKTTGIVLHASSMHARGCWLLVDQVVPEIMSNMARLFVNKATPTLRLVSIVGRPKIGVSAIVALKLLF